MTRKDRRGQRLSITEAWGRKGFRREHPLGIMAVTGFSTMKGTVPFDKCSFMGFLH